MLDICLKKVLEEKICSEFVKRFLTNMVNPEKLTFPTLVLIYETYGRLEGFRYPDWFWDEYCENCGTCCNCDNDEDNPTDLDDEDNPMDLAAAAMGFRKVRVYREEDGYSTDDYLEDSDY